MLAQAAISALDRFEAEPEIFFELQDCSKRMHTKFNKFSCLKLRGNEISPVKHLYLKNDQIREEEEKLLGVIVEKVYKSNSCQKIIKHFLLLFSAFNKD